MFCTKCGTQVPDGMAFCTNCGAALDKADTPAKPAEEAPVAAKPEPAVSSTAETALLSSLAEPEAVGGPAPAEETVVLDVPDAPSAPEASDLPDSAFMPQTPEPYAPAQEASQPKSVFCMSCGATVPDGMAFCTKCGTPVGQAGAGAGAAAAAGAAMGAGMQAGYPQPDPYAQPGYPQQGPYVQPGYPQQDPYAQPGYPQQDPYMQPMANPYEQPKSGGKKGLIIAIAAVIVAAIAAVLVIFVVLPMVNGEGSGSAASSSASAEGESDEESAETPENASGASAATTRSASSSSETELKDADSKFYNVTLGFTGSAYDDSKATPVPVHVTGKTDDGDKVDFVVYANDGYFFMQAPGSYTATIDASPLTEDGTLFNVSGIKVQFVVDEDTAGDTVKFDIGGYAIEPGDVTDNQIAAASAAAKEAGVSDSDIEAMVKATEDKRTKAQDAAKKAEEEKKAAEEKKKKEEEEKAKAEAEAKAKEEATWYVCASDFVTLRTSPSTSATAIVRITSREPVTYIADAGGGWSEVEYNGSRGYVLTRFISKDKNAPLDYGDV